MSGREAAAKNRKKSITRSKRAGLIFSVSRVHKILRNGKYTHRVGRTSSVYLAAVLEYISAEILELATKAAIADGKIRVLPWHLMLAVGNDDELFKLLRNVTISENGGTPKIDTENDNGQHSKPCVISPQEQ